MAKLNLLGFFFLLLLGLTTSENPVSDVVDDGVEDVVGGDAPWTVATEANDDRRWLGTITGGSGRSLGDIVKGSTAGADASVRSGKRIRISRPEANIQKSRHLQVAVSPGAADRSYPSCSASREKSTPKSRPCGKVKFSTAGDKCVCAVGG